MAPLPEPGTLALLAVGLISLLVYGWKEAEIVCPRTQTRGQSDHGEPVVSVRGKNMRKLFWF